MKTTQLFVEQVIIGFLVFFLGLIFFNHGNPDTAISIGNAGMEKGAIVLAGVYVLGMIYDRVADTLMSHLEAHNLIQYGLKNRVSGKDLFPVDKINLWIMKDSGLLDDHLAYIRHRIRITRAVTTLVPGYGSAACLKLAQIQNWHPVGSIMLAVYVLVVVAKASGFLSKPIKTYSNKAQKVKNSEISDIQAYLKTHETRLLTGDDILKDASMWGLGIILILNFYILQTKNEIEYALMLSSLILMGTILSGWVWWRISKTQVGLQRTYHEEYSNRITRYVRKNTKK